MTIKAVTAALLCGVALGAHAAETPPPVDAARVSFAWGVKVPMRDGVSLNATVYTPKGQKKPAPCLFTLTPYISQSYHERGMYFAANGYPFLTVDVRGRGNSEGQFKPSFAVEARDGADLIAWLARQPYCNGKVASWGGSYAGSNQWSMAVERPPALATIVPAAADQEGVDWPMHNNIAFSYLMQWLTLTSGRTAQFEVFGDWAFWASRFREWFESGRPFRELDRIVGNPSPVFQEWLANPTQGPYYDAIVPKPAQYAKLDIPVLTITGAYDGDQPGALAYYAQHMKYGNASAKKRHYLIIGPWDHAGTRTPQAEFGGLKFGPASLVDLPKLHTEWYAWTMQSGGKPEFLKKRVAYYVIGAEKWRYADTLEGVTKRLQPLYLDSTAGSANSLFAAGTLGAEPGRGAPDRYVYDPRDISIAALETAADPDATQYTDQRLLLAQDGKHLVYHSTPFAQDTELSGFFKLSAWLALDQPDTDFQATVYEVLPDGSSVLLTSDAMRARYRESLRQEKLVPKGEILRYDFDRFTFISRLVRKGSRLRLVFAPINSIYVQKNYNSGGVVSDETMADARPVTVVLHHDAQRPSALYIPIAQPE
jgi:uncharacterized protein